MKNLIKSLKYLLPFIGAYLGALGGQGVKQWRRVILPFILAICGIINIGWWGLTLGGFGAWASMGYGIPDPITEEDCILYHIPEGKLYKDEGSTIGRFWWKLFNKNHKLADIFTRGTVGIGMCLSGLAFPIIKGNWVFYVIGCLFILIGQTIFSYRGWGEVKIFGTNLLVSDLINYNLIFIAYLLMLI